MSHTTTTINLTDATFDAAIQVPYPILIDFWASWCGPCRAIGPIIDELAEEYQGKKVSIYKMNIDENSDVPSRLGIKSIPTILIFKDGQLVDRIVGVVSKAVLQAKLNQQVDNQ